MCHREREREMGGGGGLVRASDAILYQGFGYETERREITVVELVEQPCRDGGRQCYSRETLFSLLSPLLFHPLLSFHL